MRTLYRKVPENSQLHQLLRCMLRCLLISGHMSIIAAGIRQAVRKLQKVDLHFDVERLAGDEAAPEEVLHEEELVWEWVA